jgi:hypothetical protein
MRKKEAWVWKGAEKYNAQHSTEKQTGKEKARDRRTEQTGFPTRGLASCVRSCAVLELRKKWTLVLVEFVGRGRGGVTVIVVAVDTDVAE